MKTKVTLLKTLFLVLCCTLFSHVGLAQVPNPIQLLITNDAQTAPNVLEVDIYLINMSATPFQLSGHQYGITYNGLIKNGGTITASWVSGSSQLSTPSQLPTAFNTTTNTNQIRINPPPAPGCGGGSVIAGLPGTRVGRLRLTNTVPFASLTPNMSINFVTGGANTRTQISAYDGTTCLSTLLCTPVVNPTGCLNTYVVTTTNAQLNPPLCTAPTLSASTVAASCAGTSDGSIDLTTTGGNPTPFDFLWSNGATSEDLTNVSAGTYTVTVSTTIGGCSVSASYTVADGAPNVVYYADVDGDTYGDPLSSTLSCTGAPVGYVADGTDCNDANAAINPGAAEVCDLVDNDCDGLIDEGVLLTFYADVDGDLYGDAGSSVQGCSAPMGYVTDNTDCNDANAAINPGAIEVCDLVDNDCDGLIDEGVQLTFYADVDGDLYGDPLSSVLGCNAPLGYVLDNTDCNDANAAINPAATEVCNGIDDDCDGIADDGLVFLTYYVDADADGFGDASATGVSSCNPIAGSVTNNGDCNDINNAINPAALEVCNGIDDNCNGLTDDGLTFVTYYADADADTYGNAAVSQSTCNGAPMGYVTDATDCDDNNAAVNPAALEVCNGIDDDCDGIADDGLVFLNYYVDGDNDGFGAGAATSSCVAIPGSVLVAGDCDDNNAAVNPAALEVCNGIDDDCNGLSDDGLTFVTYYADADADTYGNPAVSQSTCNGAPMGYVTDATDCDDNNAAVNPAATEVCNGIDDDCDGLVDEGLVFLTYYVDADGDGFGDASALGVSSCNPIVGSVTNNGDCNDNNNAINPAALEVCNGIDDNCNGLSDDGLTFVTYYADADADTYGNAAVSQSTCNGAPMGYVTDATDCDDNNAAVNPAATEVCNNIDDDCDGLTDEGLVFLDYYVDGDNDGFGAGAATSSCVAIPGSVLVAGDCDDNNAAVNPAALEVCNGIDDDCNGLSDDGLVFLNYYVDGDNDGFGAGAATSSCVAIPGSVLVAGDCDDNNAAVNPAALEVCNGIDDDCNGLSDDGLTFVTYYADADGDTYGNALVSQSTCNGAPVGYVTDATDCNDGNAAVNPGATEVCNGIDDDCDGLVDEGLVFLTYYVDADGDGFGDANAVGVSSCNPIAGSVTNNGDCNDAAPLVNPGAAEQCNGVDDDCNGLIDDGIVFQTWYADADGDTYGNAAMSQSACSQPVGYVLDATDCNDASAAVNPGATEVCNGIDDDCDGLTDDADPSITGQSTWYADVDGDTYGNAASSVLACNMPVGYVADATDCNDNNAAVNPGATEVCNGIDDDCDGLTDEGLVFLDYYVDGDNDGYGAGAATSSCVAIPGSVLVAGDCDDNNAAVNPAALEVCNGIDDDCNGLTDDGLTFVTYYADADGDTYGNAASSVSTCNGAPMGYVSDATDCDDNNAAVNPGATEVCNLIDDDCDGLVDEGVTLTFYADVDGDNYGNAASSIQACSAPLGYVADNTDCNDNDISVNPGAAEVCGNLIDDNCDGTVDEGCTCVNPPTANAGSNAVICAGSNVTLAGSIGGGATNGTWSTSGDGSFSPSASVLNATYIPGPADILAGTVTLTLTTDAPINCTPAVSSMMITIQQNPASPGAISGPSQLCNPFNTTITYSIAPVVGATSYTWSVPNGTVLLFGQGTTSITVNWPFAAIHAGVVGNICVSANNSNSCGSGTPSCLGISVQLSTPVTPPSISGAAKACPTDVVTYSVALVARADSYNWTVPAGAAVIAGQGTNVVQVEFSAGFTGGPITVAAINGCGSSPVRSRNVSLNILPASASISGQGSGVCGATGVSYTATAVVGAASYFWTVPSGATIASGQGTGTIMVDFSGSYGGGSISVVAQNGCGNGAARSLTVTGAPGIASPITGPVGLCANQNYMYGVSTIAGASTYTWTVPSGFVIQSGQGTKDIVVKAGANPASGLSISVRASNACGTGPIRLLNGISITLCPRIGEGAAMNIVAYPNPVSDLLNVSFDSDKNQDVLVTMMDAAGRVVLNDNRNADEGTNKFEVSVKGMASGIYTMSLRTADAVQMIRVVVE
jgi:PKD-like domain/Putative metal-binding motif/Secretion system C-terminal sorting domain/SprB repeat